MKIYLGITPLCRKKTINSGDGINTYISMLINNECYKKIKPIYYSFGSNKQNLFNNIYLYKVSYLAYLFFSLIKLNKFFEIPTINKNDIIHAPDHRVPYSRGIVVSTIHDVIPIKHPEWEKSFFRRLIFPLIFRMAINRSDYIIAPSDYSANDIMRYTQYPKERISVIHHGIDNRYFKTYDDIKKIQIKNKYKIIGNYYLSVGTLQPRKNYNSLIDSYLMLPDSIKRKNSLVIIGKYGWLSEDLIARIKYLSETENILWLDYVPVEDLFILYAGAIGLVFLSLEEGFGLPILEAYASKIPVIASKASSIEEIAGDAAILVNPINTREISDAMLGIYDNPNLKKTLIEKGFDRVKTFNWDLAAQKTIQAYIKALELGKK